jgi:hypothetical protein
MVESLAVLLTLMMTIQSFMVDFEMGRSWAFSVSTTLLPQLEANKPQCCEYVKVNGVILRANNHVYLIKVR